MVTDALRIRAGVEDDFEPNAIGVVEADRIVVRRVVVLTRRLIDGEPVCGQQFEHVVDVSDGLCVECEVIDSGVVPYMPA